MGDCSAHFSAFRRCSHESRKSQPTVNQDILLHWGLGETSILLRLAGVEEEGENKMRKPTNLESWRMDRPEIPVRMGNMFCRLALHHSHPLIGVQKRSAE